MSALHQAVARAIAEQFTSEHHHGFALEAAAAIRVCDEYHTPQLRAAHESGYQAGAEDMLAEAKRSIEALGPRSSATGAGRSGYKEARADVLAVLAALAEERA